MKNIPQKIYLQVDPEGENEIIPGEVFNQNLNDQTYIPKITTTKV